MWQYHVAASDRCGGAKPHKSLPVATETSHCVKGLFPSTRVLSLYGTTSSLCAFIPNYFIFHPGINQPLVLPLSSPSWCRSILSPPISRVSLALFYQGSPALVCLCVAFPLDNARQSQKTSAHLLGLGGFNYSLPTFATTCPLLFTYTSLLRPVH